MAVTLKNIADELGVSQMTVSRALRGVSRINPRTRQKVRQAAVRLGYQPIGGVMFSPTIRSGKGNHTLRLLLPTIGRRGGFAFRPCGRCLRHQRRGVESLLQGLTFAFRFFLPSCPSSQAVTVCRAIGPRYNPFPGEKVLREFGIG
jgi:hypothetical protein